MKLHLIGIGGVGMSALATLLIRQGETVTGADRTLGTPNIRFLESLGVKVFPDDGTGVDDTTDEVIVSTAIEVTNPGLVKAQALSIPVTHRAKALSRALAAKKLVAVVGTCGKSTVTAMLGHVLSECGFNPLCVNGANVPGWEGAVRFGAGAYAVAEVDESDRSLVAFRPYAAIVTNASADHYSKEEMDEVFDAFVKDCPGPVIDGRADAMPSSRQMSEVRTSLPGRHNRQNAALALRMALALGCDEKKARAALLTFKGVERRLQRIGAHVFDDYAHNPEKLRAMWETLAEAHPEGLCAVWRPHGYAPLRKMMDALEKMFAETVRPNDRLLLLPVYDAGGTADRTVGSGDLERRLRDRINVGCVDTLDEAYFEMVDRSEHVGALVTCGARDPNLPRLAKRLAGTRVARTFLERARGLIARPKLGPEEALYIPHCRCVHTCFMRYPIDLTFLDAFNRPVRVVRNVRPWRFWVWGGWQAKKVIETAAPEALDIPTRKYV